MEINGQDELHGSLKHITVINLVEYITYIRLYSQQAVSLV